MEFSHQMPGAESLGDIHRLFLQFQLFWAFGLSWLDSKTWSSTRRDCGRLSESVATSDKRCACAVDGTACLSSLIPQLGDIDLFWRTGAADRL